MQKEKQLVVSDIRRFLNGISSRKKKSQYFISMKNPKNSTSNKVKPLGQEVSFHTFVIRFEHLVFPQEFRRYDSEFVLINGERDKRQAAFPGLTSLGLNRANEQQTWNPSNYRIFSCQKYTFVVFQSTGNGIQVKNNTYLFNIE